MTRLRGSGWQWSEIRRKQLKRFPLCAHCMLQGFTTLAEEVDHIVPLHKNGSPHDFSNLQSLCKADHLRKSLAERGYKSKTEFDSNGEPVSPFHPWFTVRKLPL